jgi:hypothetical protein
MNPRCTQIDGCITPFPVCEKSATGAVTGFKNNDFVSCLFQHFRGSEAGYTSPNDENAARAPIGGTLGGSYAGGAITFPAAATG